MIEYNTIVGGGDYEIRFKTDNKESYKEIEKHIQYLIDKIVVEREKMQLSTSKDTQRQIQELKDEVNLLKWRVAFIAQTERSVNSEI